MATMEQSERKPDGSPLGSYRARLVVVALTVAAAAIGAALLFAFTGTESATTQSVVATLRVQGTPNAISAGEDALWASLIFPERNASTLVRLNLATGATERSVAVDGALGGFPVRLGGGLWVGRNGDFMDTKPGELLEVDWRTGRVLGNLPFPGPVFGITRENGSLWVVAGREPATLVRVNPATRRAIGLPITLSGMRVIGLAFGEGALWASAYDDGELLRIDPGTGRVTRVDVGGTPVGVLVAGGSVWVTDRDGGTVVRVDPRTMQRMGEPIHVGGLPTAVASAAGSVWVSNQADGTVVRIDPASGAKIGSPIRVADPSSRDAAAHSLSVAGDSLWVASMTERTVSRIDTQR